MKTNSRKSRTVDIFQNAYSNKAHVRNTINAVAEELKAVGISLTRFGYAFNVLFNEVVVTLGETKQDADVARALFARKQYPIRLSDSQRKKAVAEKARAARSARNEKAARTRLENASADGATGEWRRAAALYVRHAVGLSEEDRDSAIEEVCTLSCETQRSMHYTSALRCAKRATAGTEVAYWTRCAAYYMKKATRARY